MKKILLLSALLALCLVIGCTSGKPIESFLLPDNNQLYFFRPSSLSGEDVAVEIDFTYNTTPSKDVICNFTVSSSEIKTHSVSNLQIVVQHDTIVTSGMKQLFRDKDLTRYSGTITQNEFRKLVDCYATKGCLSSFVLAVDSKEIMLTQESSFLKAMNYATSLLSR